MSDNSTLSTSDRDFISFSFSVVSILILVLYVRKIFQFLYSLKIYYSSPKKTRGEDPLVSIWEFFASIPNLAFTFLGKPEIFRAGVKFLLNEKMFFFAKVIPKFISRILRPRFFLPVLWVLLFSSVMYNSLTFDAHAVLNVPKSASNLEIKKAYRNLVKQYHPDVNSTEEAKAIFVQARRAYKALVDREAFEEEEMKSTEFSVGIALPYFLLSHEHDGLVLFGLLGIVIGFPLFVWRKMTNSNNIRNLIKTIDQDIKYTEAFMKQFGIPEYFKYVEKKISRDIIHSALSQIGIVSKSNSLRQVSKYPPLHDFIQRCIDADHQMNFLEALGFGERAIGALKTYMTANGDALTHQYEMKLSTIPNIDTTNFNYVPNADYKVALYFYRLHIAEMDKALTDLLKENDNIPSAKKLLRFHQEVLDNLQYLFSGTTKKNKNALYELIQVPQKVCELVENIPEEIFLLYRRHYKNELEKSISKKEMRAYKKRSTTKNIQ